MQHRHSYRHRRTGFVACVMAYVLAAQVTLALLLGAGHPVSLAYTDSGICHVQAPTGQADAPANAPAASAPHCPLCVSPAFALLTPPDAPRVALQRTPGIAFKLISSDAAVIVAIDRAHRARAPPAQA
ncbi:hypothetical protein RPMA_13150 [Tardiphaga alba]|uniref:DUF2946 domain-containing protein n=1 Tax=Tardiphaga alba TaxID=340268 RepID=A0ABX8ACY5_9BRAD|nr:hypothetical protein [Tardiphaga alba]QUS39680.1 hypothetical protein RPMA_13150 [Tardiphaga alba]